MRIIVSEEPLGQALCDLVSAESGRQTETPEAPAATAATSSDATWRALMTGLWGTQAPNSLRLLLVLAQWGQVRRPHSSKLTRTAQIPGPDD